MRLNIVVVDDEPPICEWLVYCLTKAFPDYPVHAASNGEEAYGLILREKPDIVFTDIRMPGMDGLALMQQVLGTLPYTAFAILTNHAEFSYARQAVSLGAKEYYLKSELRAADIEGFVAGVLKRKQEIEAQKQPGDLFPSGSIDLYSLYKNRDTPGYADRFWEKQGMADRLPYVVLATRSAYDPQLWQLLVEAPRKVLPAGQPQLYGVVASIQGSHYILLQAPQAQQLESLLLPLAHTVLDTTGLAVGISLPCRVRGDFEVVARQAHCALDATFFSGTKLLRYATLAGRPSLDRPALRKGKQAVLELLAQRRLGEAAPALEAWFDPFAQVSAGDVEWAISYCRRMVLAVEERYLQQTDTHAQQMEMPQTMAECKSRCAELIAQLYRHQAGKCSPAVEAALSYIHQHYSEALSMAGVARQVYRSPEYFSRQFKEEVGENFSVYLTLYRLNRAQELLRTTDHRVSEIAGLVGYTTPTYFSRLYKKYKGIAPDQERRSKL